MTHKNLLLAFVALVVFVSVHAQHYNFELSNESYVPIEQPDLSGTDTSGGILLSFSFPFRNKPFMAFGKEQKSDFVVGTNGYLLTQIPENAFTFDPFLADLYIKPDTSKVVVAESMLGTDSILEVEWQQMGLIDHPAGDYVNFKLRWFQDSRTIEFHYGPSRITRDSAFEIGQRPIIVISHLSYDFNTVKEQYFLGGDPDAPNLRIYPQFSYVNGFPSAGTVYRFIDPAAGVKESDSRQTLLEVYPNPAQNKVNISARQELQSYELVNLNGTVVEMGFLNGSRFEIDLAQQEPGMYLLRVIAQNQERFIKRITTY